MLKKERIYYKNAGLEREAGNIIDKLVDLNNNIALSSIKFSSVVVVFNIKTAGNNYVFNIIVKFNKQQYLFYSSKRSITNYNYKYYLNLKKLVKNDKFLKNLIFK